MDIEISAKSMTVLAELRNRLADPHHNWGRLPDVSHTGEEVKTLEEVCGLMGVDQQVAALAVLQSKTASPELVAEAKDVYAASGGSVSVVSLGQRGTSRRERRERLSQRAGALAAGRARRRKRKKKDEKVSVLHAEEKALHGNEDSDFEGLCIMLDITPKKHYAWPGGVKPEDLHITVAWYGNLKDHEGTDNEGDWISGLTELAEKREAFIATLGGITRFSAYPDPDSDEPVRDPIVVNVDSPDVEQIRRDVVDAFGKGASNHGYTPHITLAYIDSDDDMPIQRFDPQPVIVDGFILAWGRKQTKIPFARMGTLNMEPEDD